MNYDLIVIGSGPGSYVTAIKVSTRKSENSNQLEKEFRWNMFELGLYSYKGAFKKCSSLRIHK